MSTQPTFAEVVNRAVEQIGAAFRHLARQAKAAMKAMKPITVLGLKRIHGPETFVDDGRWQSTVCSAWLHRSCELPQHCDCTCHGGTLR